MISFSIGMWELVCSRPEVKVLLAGPTNSGKTTIGELLKRGCQPKGPHVDLNNVTTPTIGMNVVRARLGVNMTVLDVGGTMRSLWPRYLQEDCDAVVFVFDAATPPAGTSRGAGDAGVASSSSSLGVTIDAALEEARLALAQVMDKAPPDLLVVLLGTHSTSLTFEQRQLAENVLMAEVMRGRQKAKERRERGDGDRSDGEDGPADGDEEEAVGRRNDGNAVGNRREGREEDGSVSLGRAVTISSNSAAASRRGSTGGAAAIAVPSHPSAAMTALSSSAAGGAAATTTTARLHPHHYPGHLLHNERISPRTNNNNFGAALAGSGDPSSSSSSSSASSTDGAFALALRTPIHQNPSSSSSSFSAARAAGPAPSLTPFVDLSGSFSRASSTGSDFFNGFGSGVGVGGRSVGGIINAAAAAHQQLSLLDDADLDFEANLLAANNPSGSTMLRRAPSGGAGSSVAIAIDAGGDSSASTAAPGTESKHKLPPSSAAAAAIANKAKATPRQASGGGSSSGDRKSKARLVPRDSSSSNSGRRGVFSASSSSSLSAGNAEPPRMIWIDAFLPSSSSSAQFSSSGGGRRAVNPEAAPAVKALFEWISNNV